MIARGTLDRRRTINLSTSSLIRGTRAISLWLIRSPSFLMSPSTFSKISKMSAAEAVEPRTKISSSNSSHRSCSQPSSRCSRCSRCPNSNCSHKFNQKNRNKLSWLHHRIRIKAHWKSPQSKNRKKRMWSKLPNWQLRRRQRSYRLRKSSRRRKGKGHSGRFHQGKRRTKRWHKHQKVIKIALSGAIEEMEARAKAQL